MAKSEHNITNSYTRIKGIPLSSCLHSGGSTKDLMLLVRWKIEKMHLAFVPNLQNHKVPTDHKTHCGLL